MDLEKRAFERFGVCFFYTYNCQMGQTWKMTIVIGKKYIILCMVRPRHDDDILCRHTIQNFFISGH